MDRVLLPVRSHSEGDWGAVYLASVLRMWDATKGDIKAAQTIIADFGSLSSVFSAHSYELSAHGRVGQAGARNIDFVRRALQEDSYRELQMSPLLANWDKLIRYLVLQVGHKRSEEVRLLSLGVKKNLLNDLCLAQGTSVHVSLDVQTILTAALKSGARSIVIAHNHPSGDPEPSIDDRVLTSNISDACRLLDIGFHDHVIVAKHRWYSFRQNGLI